MHSATQHRGAARWNSGERPHAMRYHATADPRSPRLFRSLVFLVMLLVRDCLMMPAFNQARHLSNSYPSVVAIRECPVSHRQSNERLALLEKQITRQRKLLEANFDVVRALPEIFFSEGLAPGKLPAHDMTHPSLDLGR